MSNKADPNVVRECVLTTFDNPYDPFDQYSEWYAFDEAYGYHSSSVLARLARTSSELSEASQLYAIEEAIDEVVLNNITGMFRKVCRERKQTE